MTKIQASIEGLSNLSLHFTWFDYSFFVALLSFSAIIGIYFGFFSKHKQNTTSEYMLGGRSMNIVPVATSLIATHISGTTLLGLPVEVYSNGTQYIMFVVAATLLSLALVYIYLPLFHHLQMTSSFQYLEQRFDRKVRLLASSIFIFANIVFTPVVIYIPALAFSQVTGYNLHLITLIICMVCVFYTTIGGLRAVVWSDFIQFILMICAVLAVIVLGTAEVGGISNVFAAAERGGRLIAFDLNPSPFVRTSFWTVSIGLTVTWIAGSGIGQTSLQRFLAVPDLKAAKRSVLIYWSGMILIKCLCLFIGLLVYAKYEHCDPLESGMVEKTDQILPYYIVDVGRKVPGLAGLFIAGIFAAGLSTMSSILNTLSGLLYEDFIKIHLSKVSEEKASNIMKWLVVVLGIIVTGLVFVVEKLGPVFQVGTSISGITVGAFLGIFTIGMTSRSANTKGVLIGAVASVLTLTVIIVGAQQYGVSKDPTLPTKIDGCENSFLLNLTNATFSSRSMETPTDVEPQEVFWLFRISFMYYSVIGFIIMMVVSTIASSLTGGAKEAVDENLLTPLFQSKKFKERANQLQTKYAGINEALAEMKKIGESDDVAE